jgi:D-lactate dehydrogenase
VDNRTELAAGFLTRLKSILPPPDILTQPEDCWAYGYENSRRHSLPQAVAFPSSHEQVVRIVDACNQYRVPLTARGRGTNTVGATVPVKGGLIVSLERMKKVIEFSPENHYLIVEPGLTYQEVQAIAGSSIRTGY